ncbi:MAG: palindromic element RPE1 domain-containing protein [Holosporales bacterium]|nr:palindromic element RPE1 domain-containing protein [Holosporales bacterium]
MEGDTEHRTAAYLSVREDSSTESTHQEAECGEFGKKSIQYEP